MQSILPILPRNLADSMPATDPLPAVAKCVGGSALEHAARAAMPQCACASAAAACGRTRATRLCTHAMQIIVFLATIRYGDSGARRRLRPSVRSASTSIVCLVDSLLCARSALGSSAYGSFRTVLHPVACERRLQATSGAMRLQFVTALRACDVRCNTQRAASQPDAAVGEK